MSQNELDALFGRYTFIVKVSLMKESVSVEPMIECLWVIISVTLPLLFFV